MLAKELKDRVWRAMPESDIKRYCIIACHVMWRELSFYAAQSRHIYDFRYLEQGLHNTPELLRQELQKAIDECDGQYDALLIGYGLCSNGIQGIVARTTPLVVMRAHDCITFFLGSKERYREYFDSHPGTYWYTPGWIDDNPMPCEARYQAVLKTYIDLYGEESAQYLLEATENWMTSYSNAAYVDLGVGSSEPYREFTRRAAEWLKWNCDFLDGDARLLKAFLSGEWDAEDFLVVPPGQEIVPSYDERVIESRPPTPSPESREPGSS